MKPRGLVFDLFGDYLRYSGGEARLQVVTTLLGAFGVPPSTARVAMTRLRDQGWLEARRDGRTTVYSLSQRGWDLLDEGRRRIFERETGSWDDQWRVVIYTVPEADRSARERVRKHLRWFGFGPLAPSTWISPHDRLEAVARALGTEQTARVDLLTARSRGHGENLAMAHRCWDLDDLNATLLATGAGYREKLARFRKHAPTGADALRERVSLVHDYRVTLFNDPDLPPELLPDGWVGGETHALFLQLHDLLQPEAEAYCRSVLEGASAEQVQDPR